MVQHQWILCEKSTDEVHLFHRSLMSTFGQAENFVSTFASTSSVGDLQLCLFFVAKLRITVLTYFFVQEYGTQGLTV